jgi:hypothetical protein
MYDRAAIMVRALAAARQASASGSPLPWQALVADALGSAWQLQGFQSGGQQTVVVQHVQANQGSRVVVAGKVGRGARGRGTAGGNGRK